MKKERLEAAAKQDCLRRAGRASEAMVERSVESDVGLSEGIYEGRVGEASKLSVPRRAALVGWGGCSIIAVLEVKQVPP